jgi:hypothetical protein
MEEEHKGSRSQRKTEQLGRGKRGGGWSEDVEEIHSVEIQGIRGGGGRGRGGT